MLPALVLYAVFVILPVLQAMQYSLYKWNGIAPLTDFVGLQNYVIALRNDVFTTSVGNNLLILVLSLAIQIPFSLALAVLLNRRFRGRAALRLLFFLPYVLSEAVTGIVFTLMLQPDSVVDASLTAIGLEGLIQDWLGDSTLVMITLFVLISWKYFGFHMIIMLAGLQGIPRELEEAALIDGADRRQSFRYVTLPLLGPTIRVSVFLSMIGALQLFDDGLGDDRRRPRQRLEHDGHRDVQGRLPEQPVRVRQRPGCDPVPVLPRRRVAVPAVRPAAGHRGRRHGVRRR